VSDNIIQNVSISGEGNIVVGKGNVIINPLPPAEARLRHDLGILLKNVETIWIKGVLEKSVHEAALLELGMELREEAIANPWRMVLEGPDQPREVIPRERKIKDIFDESNRLLLILGEPGSGKTTTLLQLARDLIAEVNQAFTQPVPVILNLSTWTNKKQPLDDWLISELSTKYRVPKRDGKRWLQDDRILFLLDGLDEVKLENRAACVENINQLVSNYGLQGMVVCSRIQDYSNLQVRLEFYRAIYLQPLTRKQVDEYLDQAGEKLASLHATLRADEALGSLAQSPLILNIMSLAYQNTSAEALRDPTLNTDEARRLHLFDRYIARMFSRKVGEHPYNDLETKQWLSWLARKMQQHNQEVFMIEGLQPDWLSKPFWQWIYILVSRLLGSLIFFLPTLMVGAWTVGITYSLRDLVRLDVIAIGIYVGLIDILRFEWSRKREKNKKSALPGWGVIYFLIIWLGAMLIYLFIWDVDMMINLGGYYAPVAAIIFGVRRGQRSLENDIRTVEALPWSWHRAVRGLIGGAVIGLVIGMILVLIIIRTSSVPFPIPDWSWTPYWVLYAMWLLGRLLAPIFGVVGLIVAGFRQEIRETKSIPNQGVQLSLRNAIIGGLGTATVLGLILGISLEALTTARGNLAYAMTGGIDTALILVLFFAPIGLASYGGFDVLQHYVLRLILFIQGKTARNYAHFLDYAVDCIFLQRVGGGYRFIHRLLLEHFANMDEHDNPISGAPLK